LKRRAALMAGLGVAAAAAATVGGYEWGKGSGPSLAAARASGERDGHRTGTSRGERDGYRRGFRAGERQGYGDAYRRAYKTAYDEALKGTPSPDQTTSPPASDCASTGAEPNISNLSVRYMTCGQAAGIIAHIGPISRTFTVLGFTCSELSGGELGGVWRCTRDQSAFRFTFGD
jgi:hypothetical protein